MKTTILKSTFLLAFTAGLFTSCVKDDDYSKPDLSGCTGTTLVKNREVSQILATSTVALHQNIVPGEPDIIEAYVTSSDIGGNFFKSISFQTNPEEGPVKAFSVPVDATNTFINYEPGRKVLIKMDGLYTDNPTSGPIGMRIGSLYVGSSGTASVGRMPEADFKLSVQPSCSSVNEDKLLPLTPVTIADIQNDSFINRLVELDNVEFSTSDINSTYYNSANDLGGATNRTLIDIEGNAIIFRTSAYANFAAKSVAKGSGKIRGVVTKYGSDFQFIVRSINDIKLSNDVSTRFTPLLNETFTTGTSFNTDWTNYSVIGSETWSYSATYGNPGGMVKMSGYNGGNRANEDWIISPAQNLTSLTSAFVSFDNAYKFTGDPIQVLVSNTYPGNGDPYATGVTWTNLTIPATGLSTGNYVYANSGNIDISTFAGNADPNNSHVYIAFKYTSTTSSGSTWEIDNVKITRN